MCTFFKQKFMSMRHPMYDRNKTEIQTDGQVYRQMDRQMKNRQTGEKVNTRMNGTDGHETQNSPRTSTSNLALASPTSLSAVRVMSPSSSLVTFFTVKVVESSCTLMVMRPPERIWPSSLAHVMRGVGIPLTFTGIFNVAPTCRLMRSRNLLSNSRVGAAVTEKDAETLEARQTTENVDIHCIA